MPCTFPSLQASPTRATLTLWSRPWTPASATPWTSPTTSRTSRPSPTRRRSSPTRRPPWPTPSSQPTPSPEDPSDWPSTWHTGETKPTKNIIRWCKKKNGPSSSQARLANVLCLFFGLEGFWVQPNFPSPRATMLALHLDCSTAALPTPQKVLSISRLVDLGSSLCSI